MTNARSRNTEASALEPRLHSTANDLFPELLPPVLPAVWPDAGTRAREALDALLSRPQNQADYVDGWRLAAYVQTLKYDGWAVRSRLIHKAGCRREIAEYSLDLGDPSTRAAVEMRRASHA